MQRILNPTSRMGAVGTALVKLVVAAVTVVVAIIAIYLFAVLNVYILAWVVEQLQKIG
jgi:hypothetical protein